MARVYIGLLTEILCMHGHDEMSAILAWRKLLSSLVWLWKGENFKLDETCIVPLVGCLCLQHSRPNRPATFSGETDLEQSFSGKGKLRPGSFSGKYCWQDCTYNQPSLQVQLLVNR